MAKVHGLFAAPIFLVVVLLGIAACRPVQVPPTVTPTTTPADSGDTTPPVITATNQIACGEGITCFTVDENAYPVDDGAFVAQCTGLYPDYVDRVPPDDAGPRFRLAQSYPPTLPPIVDQPWLALDFRDPASTDAYLLAVRAYVYDGMLEADWIAQANTRRPWFHMPWMHAGNNPREFLRGVTSERVLSNPELGLRPNVAVHNWAIGYYNDIGGYTIGQVWHDAAAPDFAQAHFAEGTVVAKVLFSEAKATDFANGVDLLAGAPTWTIHPRGSDPAQRVDVRLLQMDIAVRDDRAVPAGWVFGTFAFDKDAAGANGWEKMMPVGLMWGNDPTLTQATYAAGQRPVESLMSTLSPPYALDHLGWLDRLNGPVDNPASACMSCHSVAEYPPRAGLIPDRNNCTTEAQKQQWFRALGGTEAFGFIDRATCLLREPAPEPLTALDYSLQMRVALDSFSRRPTGADGSRPSRYNNPCMQLPGGSAPAHALSGAFSAGALPALPQDAIDYPTAR